MCKCVQKRSALLKWDLLIQKIQPLVYRKKLILICELGCVQGIMHFIIQSALLDCSFPILVSYIRLVYCTSNFQIVAIVLTSFVKATFSLQLHQSNSKFTWLASKKEQELLKQVTHCCISILFFEIIAFFTKINFHWYGSQSAS